MLFKEKPRLKNNSKKNVHNYSISFLNMKIRDYGPKP